MSSDENSATKVGVPMLTVEPAPQDLVSWKTLARASFTLKDASAFLSEKPHPELQMKQADVGTDAAKKPAIKRHHWANAATMFAMQKNPRMLDIVQDMISKDWPEGEMHKMMKEMSKEFAPDNDFGNVAKDKASDQILPSTKNKANPQILLDSIAARCDSNTRELSWMLLAPKHTSS